MHSKDLVIHFGRQHFPIWDGQLRADEHGIYTTDQEEEEGCDHIHDADFLMVGRHEPVANVGFTQAPATSYAYTFGNSAGCHRQFLRNLVL